MIGIYILVALIGIFTIVEIILNFAEIIAFFGFAFELLSNGYYAEGIFGVIIAAAMIIALLMPAMNLKEWKKDRADKGRKT